MTRVLVADVETSGLDPAKGAGVVELAGLIVDVMDGELFIGDDFQTLVNPGHTIPPETSCVHHIVDAHVADAPDLSQACVMMREKLGEWDYVTGHNAVGFDKKFLPDLHDRPWSCTLKGARTYLTFPKYSNQYLRYAIPLNVTFPEHCDGMAHRALADCYVTAELLRHLLNHCTLEQLASVSSRPVLKKGKVGFGKHADMNWPDLPRSYLSWMLSCTGEKGFDEDTTHSAKYYLSRK